MNTRKDKVRLSLVLNDMFNFKARLLEEIYKFKN